MSSTEYQFHNLVFEGGGVKGIAYAGALEVLQEKGILPLIERVAGTSAGAITAALLAVGFTPAEIRSTLSQTDVAEFKDDSFFFLFNLIFFWRTLIFNNDVGCNTCSMDRNS